MPLYDLDKPLKDEKWHEDAAELVEKKEQADEEQEQEHVEGVYSQTWKEVAKQAEKDKPRVTNYRGK